MSMVVLLYAYILNYTQKIAQVQWSLFSCTVQHVIYDTTPQATELE